MPEVMILLPVYNGAGYLPQAMESLLAQTYTDWRLLAVDDGSNDATPELLADYARRDGRVQVERLAHGGLVAALNHGLALALASPAAYLARMDADDVAHPQRLVQQTAALHGDPELVVCGSAYRLLADDRVTGALLGMPQHDTAIRWQALFHSPFAHPAVMLRLDTLRRHDLRYDPAQRLVEDFDLWSRLLRCGRGCNLPAALLDYRLHAASVSLQAEDAQWQAANRVAQASLAALGVALTPEQTGTLRRWFYRFPHRLSPSERPLARLALDVLERFSALPGLDVDELAAIRGRWLFRLLLVRGGGGLRQAAWRARRAGDGRAVWRFMLSRRAASAQGGR